MLTIIAAMEEELAAVRTALADSGAGASMPGRAGAETPAPAFSVIGIGRQGVESGLRGALPTLRQQRRGAPPPGPLLLLGFAGGVAPSLATGDLTLASRYYRLVPQPEPLRFAPDGMTPPEFLQRIRAGLRVGLGAGPFPAPRLRLGPGSRYLNPIIPRRALLKHLEPDPALLQCAREALAQAGLAAVETGSMTVEELVTDSHTKGELHRRYPVGTVNMEDYWVARLAAAARAPFLSVRAVLDTADQELPSYLPELSGQPGWAALTRPWRIPTLLRLSGQLNQAQASLARFAAAFVRHWAAGEAPGREESG